MKSQIFATFTCLTLLTAAGALAQSAAVMQLDIPFEFRAGGAPLPAGHYEVRPLRASNVLSIRCYECKAGAMLIANGVQASHAPEKGSLVFRRYGNTYFLSKVWTAGNPQGRELPESKAEQELKLAGSGPPATDEVLALAER
jgi:hypothetical protein